jgi:flavorubredoxin
VRALYPPIRFVVLLSSYGWGAAAVKQMQEILDPLKVEVVGTLEVNGPPTEENIKQIVEIGKLLAGRIKGVS